VVQEVVNRGDWASGNSLSVILKGTGSAWGRKFVRSYNGSAANAPKLVITYTAPGGSAGGAILAAAPENEQASVQLARLSDAASRRGVGDAPVIAARALLDPPPVTEIVTKTYYYAGSSLIAMRVLTGTTENTLYYLHSDHLGSTSLTTSDTGAVLARQYYYPYGGVRSGDGLPTDIGFTGQRAESSGLGSLMFFRARYYSPLVGRFVSADTLVPGAYNPQSLNRYSYVLGNPTNYTDPSGHDPLDAEWERLFREQHGRKPTDRDRQDRLFSLTYRGSGPDGAWTDDDWEWYTNNRDPLWAGKKFWRNDDQSPGLDRFIAHVGILASYYTDDERDQFVRAFALLYAGIPYSCSWQRAAVSIGIGSRPLGGGLREGMDSWHVDYMDSAVLAQDQTHHYAGLFFLGYFSGKTVGRAINRGRDSSFRVNDGSLSTNMGDINLGNLAVDQAVKFRNMSPSQLATDLLPALRKGFPPK